MPIPYMGSKRKSATKIFNTIKNLNPDSSTLVDLFCGGFAIGELFFQNGYNVIANDLNKYVIALLNQTIKIGLDEEKCLEFITRDILKDIIKNPDKYDDWYVGYAMCCWTFGNNSQKAYLFGKDVEPLKYAGHKLVVNKNPIDVIGIISQKNIDGILKQTDWHKRRIALGKVANTMRTRVFELQQLQRLERLQQLQQLQRLERLQFCSKSYNEINIPKDAIIYCDPPYIGTAEYSEGSFNHDEFWDWVRSVSKKNKIYISEYNAPDDFISILAFDQKSTLQGGTQKHNNQPKECLFVPIDQEKYG